MTPRPRPEWIGKRPESKPPISAALRVLEAQGGLCGCPDNCGIAVDFDRDELDVDHNIPLRDGGENRESNLRVLLRRHHRKKTLAENIARGEERRHKAKAFKRPKHRWGKQRLGNGNNQHTATTLPTKRVGHFPETNDV